MPMPTYEFIWERNGTITRNNNVKLSGKGKDKGKPQKPAKWAQHQTRAYKQAASELRARIRDEYKADTYSTELHLELEPNCKVGRKSGAAQSTSAAEQPVQDATPLTAELPASPALLVVSAEPAVGSGGGLFAAAAASVLAAAGGQQSGSGRRHQAGDNGGAASQAAGKGKGAGRKGGKGGARKEPVQEEPREPLNAYAQQREDQIADNQARLAASGLGAACKALGKATQPAANKGKRRRADQENLPQGVPASGRVLRRQRGSQPDAETPAAAALCLPSADAGN